MFSLFRKPEVEFVELQEQQLVFHSRERLPEGRIQSVHLTGADVPSREVRVAIQRVRPLENGGFACVGTVRDSSALRGARPVHEIADLSSLRKHPREECSIPVLSVELPGYHATAIDVSQGGMQLMANGRARVGDVLRLSLFPNTNEAVDRRVKVAWISGQLDTGFRVGVVFEDGAERSSPVLAEPQD